MKHPFTGLSNSEMLPKIASIIKMLNDDPGILDRLLSRLPTLQKLQEGQQRFFHAFTENIGANKQEAVTLAAERRALDLLLGRLTGLVYLMSDEDPELLELFGLRKRTKRKGSILLTAPANPRLRHGIEHGVIIAKVTAVKSARSYEAQVCEGDPLVEENWRPYSVSSRVTFEMNRFVPGVLYWFRFRGIGPSGAGPWSISVSLRAI